MRAAYGFHECTTQDQAGLAEWPAAELCPVELSRERLAEAVVARCRKKSIEPPAPAKVARVVGSAVSTFESRFCGTTMGRLSAITRTMLDELVAEDDRGDGTASVGGGQTFFNRANLRAALVRLVNATFTARDERWRGAGSSCASDSKKFGSWSTNLMDLFYGKDGDLTGDDKESQEVSMLALHLVRSSLVHVNTLLLQEILAEPKWAEKLTDVDRRALSPLFWTHVNPCGRFELDMGNRLGLSFPAVPQHAPARRIPEPESEESSATEVENAVGPGAAPRQVPKPTTRVGGQLKWVGSVP
ncbi:Tn3 family transposase [Streptomyces sp. NPDC041068]|uniref:Tn3 family transposase n=1 Tax=Streptomyces sp. NPDC041068 TaxID=3155130 RepID=UPI0034095905